jgi:hypothetical protein
MEFALRNRDAMAVPVYAVFSPEGNDASMTT